MTSIAQAVWTAMQAGVLLLGLAASSTPIYAKGNSGDDRLGIPRELQGEPQQAAFRALQEVEQKAQKLRSLRVFSDFSSSFPSSQESVEKRQDNYIIQSLPSLYEGFLWFAGLGLIEQLPQADLESLGNVFLQLLRTAPLADQDAAGELGRIYIEDYFPAQPQDPYLSLYPGQGSWLVFRFFLEPQKSADQGARRIRMCYNAQQDTIRQTAKSIEPIEPIEPMELGRVEQRGPFPLLDSADDAPSCRYFYLLPQYPKTPEYSKPAPVQVPAQTERPQTQNQNQDQTQTTEAPQASQAPTDEQSNLAEASAAGGILESLANSPAAESATDPAGNNGNQSAADGDRADGNPTNNLADNPDRPPLRSSPYDIDSRQPQQALQASRYRLSFLAADQLYTTPTIHPQYSASKYLYLMRNYLRDGLSENDALVPPASQELSRRELSADEYFLQQEIILYYYLLYLPERSSYFVSAQQRQWQLNGASSLIKNLWRVQIPKIWAAMATVRLRHDPEYEELLPGR